ncbi:MAG: leucine-rich repeat domain-containing protein [Prevotella sp.]|nr:leucine-rich repeat domain-containing protein [Prevotella sp.]
MKKLFTLGLVLCACLQALAYEWTDSDGMIWSFDISGTKATNIKPAKLIYGDVVIPSTVYVDDTEYTVVSIGGNAFSYKGLTSAVIPEGITSIGDSAFYTCSHMASVAFPSTLTTIGIRTFARCSSLSEVTIPKSVKGIGLNAFADCSSLKKVIVPNIKAWCKVNFANSQANPLHNGGRIYRNESSEITKLVIPSGVSSISPYAFQNCLGLKSITLSNGVKTIGDYAFSNCTNLTNLSLPSSVTKIGSFAFYHCLKLTSLTIPSGVTSMGEGVFCDCIGLTSVDIKEGATTIGDAAFSYCENIATLTIPSSVTYIGLEAFDRCDHLLVIYCHIVNPPEIDVHAFSQSRWATLYIPYGCKTTYQNMENWCLFKEIIEMDAPGEDLGVITNMVDYTTDDTKVYDQNGRRQPTMRHGVNIIKMKDGSTRKVLMK